MMTPHSDFTIQSLVFDKLAKGEFKNIQCYVEDCELSVVYNNIHVHVFPIG